MAVLEAFVYDPLLNWRLLGTSDGDRKVGRGGGGGGTTGSSGMSGGLRGDMFETGLSSSSIGSEASPSVEDMLPPSLNYVGMMGLADLVTSGDGDEMLINDRALAVINRVSAKLTGTDFEPHEPLDIAGTLLAV